MVHTLIELSGLLLVIMVGSWALTGDSGGAGRSQGFWSDLTREGPQFNTVDGADPNR